MHSSAARIGEHYESCMFVRANDAVVAKRVQFLIESSAWIGTGQLKCAI
ncbi:MAG: hypothetical protein MT490_04885 [Sphingomonas sp.]|nr:hypothetical protein [Sphingomonas sp.]MCX8475116.1 hypothetical protein [Sphingomonas sp.]